MPVLPFFNAKMNPLTATAMYFKIMSENTVLDIATNANWELFGFCG